MRSIAERVGELLKWGITPDNARILIEILGRELCKELNLEVDYLNTRLFPSTDVIRSLRTCFVQQQHVHKVCIAERNVRIHSG